MGSIDSDAHVIETPRTWEFMDEADRKYAPLLLTQSAGPDVLGNEGNIQKEYWLIDNRAHARDRNVGYDTSEESREMTDIEARLRHPDVLILGGLNEGAWPPEPAVDPWLSRPMRKDFGLPPPERRIGLSAHDFAQGFCAREVVLTRAIRVEGTPTVPSRWLLRLETLLRLAGLEGRIEESREWLGWQRGLDLSERVIPAERPAPRPPAISFCACRSRSKTCSSNGWRRTFPTARPMC